MTGYGLEKTGQVHIDDLFWNQFRETLIREGISYQWKALNDELPEDTAKSHCLANFRIAAGKEQGSHQGWVFQDSDIYKWLEGVAYSLRFHPDEKLEELAEYAIDTIADAQQPDGYLNTYYTIGGLDKRWTNLRDNHELYCAGHLIEAAVAYFSVTGKRRLLDIALRFVDHIDATFGPEEGKKKGYPGHPVIEMALMRLYALTGDKKHLHLAKYFIDQRGELPLYFAEEAGEKPSSLFLRDSTLGWKYWQVHLPVREQRSAEGHAVRAMYLYCGMADVARETEDETLAKACRHIWDNTIRKKMYVTGGVGSSEYGEAFTFDYDLPNDTNYAETCAAIGLVFFARRMLRLYPLGEYADVMERALYNGVLSGMQLDGKQFFYVNPLEVVPKACALDYNKRHVKPERQKWFGCACCPPNIIRLLCSLEDYIYDAWEETLFLHLFIGGTIETQGMTLQVETNYPWKGRVSIRVLKNQGNLKNIALRIPGWCKSYQLLVKGKPVRKEALDGYIHLPGPWMEGDQIDLTLDMPVRILRANPAVREDAGLVTLQRGPFIYCLEEADNGEGLHRLRLDTTRDIKAIWKEELLGGVMLLEAEGFRETEEGWETLYEEERVQEERAVLRWIPYYAWANRGLGEMRVWVRR